METIVAFVGIERSDAVRGYVLEKTAPLVRAPGVLGCRVALEGNRYHHAGERFRVKVEIDVTGTTLVVGSRGESFADLYAAIDAITTDAKLKLREHTSRARILRRTAREVTS